MATKKKDTPPPADPFPKRVYFGRTTEKYVEEQKVRKRKAREKKFPTMKEAGRPMPVNRHSAISPQEKKIIALMLEDQPQDISKEQVEHLAVILRRNPETIKQLVLQARDQFIDNAKLYVEVHAKSVQSAYANGEFDTALRGSQWAMENLSSEGVGVIEAANKAGPDSGPKVVIGVNLGGMTPRSE